MKYRRLGDSDLSVSEIALGSWLTYSGGIDAQTARACVHKALSVGINFIDTANIYGRGAAETFLGETLANVPRDTYVLATKLYFPMTETDRGLSRAQIHKQLDASLKRLKTDYVDLYQCHRFDPETPLEETMQALTEVVQAGKARYVGFSEWPAEVIAEAIAMEGVVRFVSSQPQYSLLWRKPENRDHPALQSQRHFADRLVAACARRADREIQARRSSCPRYTGNEPRDGRISSTILVGTARSGSRSESEAYCQGGGVVAHAIRARMGPAHRQRGFSDHRRNKAGSGRGECEGIRAPCRSFAVS